MSESMDAKHNRHRIPKAHNNSKQCKTADCHQNHRIDTSFLKIHFYSHKNEHACGHDSCKIPKQKFIFGEIIFAQCQKRAELVLFCFWFPCRPLVCANGNSRGVKQKTKKSQSILFRGVSMYVFLGVSLFRVIEFQSWWRLPAASHTHPQFSQSRVLYSSCLTCYLAVDYIFCCRIRNLPFWVAIEENQRDKGHYILRGDSFCSPLRVYVVCLR